MSTEVSGELNEGAIFLEFVVEDADGAQATLAGQTNDAASRAAEMVLQGLQAQDGSAEMLRKKLLTEVHSRSKRELDEHSSTDKAIWLARRRTRAANNSTERLLHENA